ncbi:MAG TPA: ammonium transporter [Caulobacterales bacterium]|nr:ammonium transporter [Caulobacterales bacterium]
MKLLQNLWRRPGALLNALRIGGAALAVGLALAAVTPMSVAFAQEAAPAATTTATTTAAEAAPAAAPAEAAPATAEIKAPEQTVDKGDTAWMLISTALVLVMTIPGLALFYGGLVRSKNVGATIMQCSVIALIGMVMWALVGYSLSFTNGTGPLAPFIGGTSRFFLNDAGTDLSDNLAATFSTGVYIPELLYVLFQMTFAAITAALVMGGLAERVKFTGIVIFSIVWPLLVYYPMAHMVWFWAGPDAVATHTDGTTTAGFLFQKGALDFAGGSVVHINSGIAALMGCLVLGRRTGYKTTQMPPHNLVWTYCGAGLLWFGWFGFNAGSNLESNYYAVLAMANTFLATAAAGLSWCLVEAIFKGKPSFLGLSSGIVAGLVAVTPASGFAGPMGSIVLGLAVSPICFIAVSFVKNLLGYDDALDVFGVHCIGGITGALATGILVNPALGGAGVVDYANCSANGTVLGTCPTAAYDLVTQMTAQGTDVVVTLLWSGVGSLVIWIVLRVLGLLRVSKDAEQEGLDITSHGEQAYHA